MAEELPCANWPLTGVGELPPPPPPPPPPHTHTYPPNGARVNRHGSSPATAQAAVPKPGGLRSATLVTSSAPPWSAAQRAASSPHLATLHGAAAAPTAAASPATQANRVRTAHTETSAATAACCGRSAAELQVVSGALGRDSKPAGLCLAHQANVLVQPPSSSLPC